MTGNHLPVQELSYEQALSELELIVNALDSDDRTLEEALDQFERGQALAKHCASLLDHAELKVQQISGENIVAFNIE